MKKNSGKEYEKFVHEIYSILKQRDNCSVELDVDLDGPEGPRQIDVLLHETPQAGVVLTCAIECRDYSRRLDIGHIDAFHSKIQDIKADNGIIVSRRGFTRKAIEKAKRVGIETCLADNLSRLLKTLRLKIPVKFNLIHSTIKLSYDLHVTKKFQEVRVDATHVITGVDLHKRLHDELLSGDLPIPEKPCEVIWSPKQSGPLNSISDPLGNPIHLENLQLSAIFGIRWFHGYLNDLSFLSAHHIVSCPEIKIIGNLGDLPNILPHITEYRHSSDRPEPCNKTINLIDIRKLSSSNRPSHVYENPGIYRLTFSGELPQEQLPR